jgi:hypothetical protein
MDYAGNVLIEPLYDNIYRDYPKKGQIRLSYGESYCVIDENGKLIEGKFNTVSPPDTNLNATPLKKSKKKNRKKRVRWL